MPRLYEATSVPSVVAIGTMNSPWACSPLICQRAGKAERNLRHAGEVLDVALERVRVERVVGDMLQLGAGVLLDELLARLDDRVAVVVGCCRAGCCFSSMLGIGNAMLVSLRYDKMGFGLNVVRIIAQPHAMMRTQNFAANKETHRR
jgi:hypothetical protein